MVEVWRDAVRLATTLRVIRGRTSVWLHRGGSVAGIEVHRLKSLIAELSTMLAGDSKRGGVGD